MMIKYFDDFMSCYTKIYKYKFLKESVSPFDCNSDDKAIQTLILGKRPIALTLNKQLTDDIIKFHPNISLIEVTPADSKTRIDYINELILGGWSLERAIKFADGNRILYINTEKEGKKKAIELFQIMKKNKGFTSSGLNNEEDFKTQRRVGELLNYHKKDIDEFISKIKKYNF